MHQWKIKSEVNSIYIELHLSAGDVVDIAHDKIELNFSGCRLTFSLFVVCFFFVAVYFLYHACNHLQVTIQFCIYRQLNLALIWSRRIEKRRKSRTTWCFSDFPGFSLRSSSMLNAFLTSFASCLLDKKAHLIFFQRLFLRRRKRINRIQWDIFRFKWFSWFDRPELSCCEVWFKRHATWHDSNHIFPFRVSELRWLSSFGYLIWI